MQHSANHEHAEAHEISMDFQDSVAYFNRKTGQTRIEYKATNVNAATDAEASAASDAENTQGVGSESSSPSSDH